MNNRGKSTFCVINSDKLCISTDLANLIYDRVEKNQLLRIKTLKQELCKPEKNEQQIELEEKQGKNPYETMLMQDIKKEELNKVACKWRNGQNIVT